MPRGARDLIEFVNGAKCQELPAIFKLSQGWQLTRSSKGDCYYMISREACSCSGFYYRRSCRHVKSLASQKEEKLTPRQELSPTPIFARDIVAAMEG